MISYVLQFCAHYFVMCIRAFDEVHRLVIKILWGVKVSNLPSIWYPDRYWSGKTCKILEENSDDGDYFPLRNASRITLEVHFGNDLEPAHPSYYSNLRTIIFQLHACRSIRQFVMFKDESMLAKFAHINAILVLSRVLELDRIYRPVIHHPGNEGRYGNRTARCIAVNRR